MCTKKDGLSITRKSDKMKTGFLQSCNCVSTNVWMCYLDSHEKQEKSLDENYPWMIHAVLNKSWRRHMCVCVCIYRNFWRNKSMFTVTESINAMWNAKQLIHIVYTYIYSFFFLIIS